MSIIYMYQSAAIACLKASKIYDRLRESHELRVDNYIPYVPPPPCEECHLFSRCKITGEACLAFKQYCDEPETGNMWLKSNMGVFKW